MEHPDLARYARQTILPGFGAESQRRLLDAHAVLVGCGTLGCVIADQLTRAGVGRITIIDRDLVEPGNLQRQVLFDERDAEDRIPKAQAAHQRLARINSDVRTEPVIADLRPSNIDRLVMRGALGTPNVVLDGTDNFETRFLINDLCVKHGLAYVYGGVVGTRGMRAVFDTGRGGACLRCVFERPPAPGSQPTCESAGVLLPAAGVIASMQSSEAIRILAGLGHSENTLVEMDLWAGTSRRVDLEGLRDPGCPCCEGQVFEHLDGPEPEAAGLCGRNAVQVMPMPGHRIALETLAQRLSGLGEVNRLPFMVRARLDEPGGLSISVFTDGRAVIEGTDDPAHARAIYARYIGA